MMDPGKLKHRVEIQSYAETVNPDTGYRSRTWSKVAKVWAEVAPLSGRELIAAGAQQSELSTRVTIRYRSDITTGMRLVHRGQHLDIKAILPDPDTGLEYLTLMCAQGVNDG